MNKKALAVATVFLLIGFGVGVIVAPAHIKPYVAERHVKKVVDIVRRNHFDPNRSAAYTCMRQTIIKDYVGMICSSPAGDATVYCSYTPYNPDEYFC